MRSWDAPCFFQCYRSRCRRLIVECAMLEPTHVEDDDRPSGGICVAVLSRPAVRMQERDRYRLVGGCNIPICKSSMKQTSLQVNQDMAIDFLSWIASLQVNQDMACQEFNSIRIEGCFVRDDIGANQGVPPQNARRKVSKSNFFIILHPAIGNLKKQSIDLHPSVGCFKRKKK